MKTVNIKIETGRITYTVNNEGIFLQTMQEALDLIPNHAPCTVTIDDCRPWHVSAVKPVDLEAFLKAAAAPIKPAFSIIAYFYSMDQELQSNLIQDAFHQLKMCGHNPSQYMCMGPIETIDGIAASFKHINTREYIRVYPLSWGFLSSINYDHRNDRQTWYLSSNGDDDPAACLISFDS